MSQIDPTLWARLSPLVDQALELSGETRVAWLQELAARSPELATPLVELLQADARAAAQGFLAESPTASMVGRVVGQYTLVRPLGHGGMGSVWLGRRTDGRFEGYAAVKLMSLALMSATGQERFRREGTALARLTHPAIARLLDAGVAPSGQPYLVLEYVDGQHIDAHATALGLSATARIHLVLQVLDAVGHAHANLIVHRDLKPSNILVTADGRVKLLDFGIAKLLQGDGDEPQGALTSDGGSALTPDYASPEQLKGEPITTATDVYALGVLLYLLLSGRHPTRGERPTPAEALRGVLEVEPRPLGHGDLDTVIAKALRKDPAERYATVAAFADDLRRYLRDEPVSARPDALSYRTRKFVRRHRVGVAAASLVTAVLVGATAFSLAQARRAEAQRDMAMRAERRASAMVDMQDLLAGDQRSPDGTPLDLEARFTLAEAILTRQYGGEPWLVSETLSQMSQHLGGLHRGGERRLLARAAQIARDGALDPQLAIAACLQSASFYEDDLLDSAQVAYAEGRAALARMREPADPATRGVCLEAGGYIAQGRGQGDTAIARFTAALTHYAPTDSRRLTSTFRLSDLLRFNNRHRDAARMQQDGLAMLGRLGYAHANDFNNAVTYLDRSLADLGEFRQVDSIVGGYIREREAAFGVGRVPFLLAFLYGMNKQRLGEVDSADRWITRATSGAWERGGTMSSWLPSTLALVRASQGRLREARAAAAQLPGGLRGRRATAAMVQATILRSEGRVVAAVRLLEGELAALYAESPTTLSLFTLPLVTAGEWRLASGDARGADSLAQLGWRAAVIDSLAPTRSGLAGRADLLRAQALRVLGDTTELRPVVTRAVAALTNGYGAGSPWTRAAVALRDSLR